MALMTNSTKTDDALIWDRELIAKYDVAGPRYTSYPTALQFTETFGAEQYREQSAQRLDSIAPLSLYVHIPFCHDICYYCACNKVVTNKKQKGREYLDYLAKEIAMQSKLHPKSRKVNQLHWGGGTPTFLSNAEITELMHMIASHFSLLDSDNREYSIEIDPRTVNMETIPLLKGLGFNRISLGVQDFDPQVQKAVNRIQPFEQVKQLTELIQSHNFKSLSFDLIYGLPYQTMETMKATLDQVIELSPDRISCYNYAHMPHRFKSQRAIDRLTLPPAEMKLPLMEYIVHRFLDAGYVFIGMDHFVKPSDDLAIALHTGKLQRNFQGYSTCLAPDLIGLGVSSISSLNDCFAQNAKNLEDYYHMLDADQLPIERGLLLSEEDKLRREVIMQIISKLSLQFADIEAKFNINFREHFSAALANLDGMIKDGLLQLSVDSIQVTELGRPMVRNICMVFDQYIEKLKESGNTHHSRTL